MYGYESATQLRTFNTYEDVHCFHSAGLHDYLKYLKYGYSKVTDHATREIRLKRITREKGIELVKKYSNIWPDDINIFLDWVGMEEKNFFSYINNFRDPQIWQKHKEDWKLLDSITNHIKDDGTADACLKIKKDRPYQISPTAEPQTLEKNYLLMGRGYIDAKNYGAIENQPIGSMTPRTWKRKSII